MWKGFFSVALALALASPLSPAPASGDAQAPLPPLSSTLPMLAELSGILRSLETNILDSNALIESLRSEARDMLRLIDEQQAQLLEASTRSRESEETASRLFAEQESSLRSLRESFLALSMRTTALERENSGLKERLSKSLAANFAQGVVIAALAALLFLALRRRK